MSDELPQGPTTGRRCYYCLAPETWPDGLNGGPRIICRPDCPTRESMEPRFGADWLLHDDT